MEMRSAQGKARIPRTAGCRNLVRCIVPLALAMTMTLAWLPASAVMGEGPEPIDWSDWRGVKGEPIVVAEARWKVVCFLGVECPLARLYGPRLSQLGREFGERGVQLLGINSNSQDSPAEIKAYANRHEVTFPIIKDSRQLLARRLGATRTPEVFVLDANDNIRYRGRIDDQYQPGIARARPTRDDLREALEALLEDRPVPVARTEAVGCRITFSKPPRHVDPSAAVTFWRDVVPVLNQHCVECHRAGEIGPFALTEYDEVKGWAEMMLEVIEQQRMPPWHADPKYGKFVGARRLPELARQTLAAWVEQGMPEGSAEDKPPAPTWGRDWQLTTAPDETFVMRERPFLVPSQGTVEYQYFVVDPKWEEDRWLKAAQLVPGDSSVVHHAIVFVRPPDGSSTEGIGWLGGYVPGQRVAPLPAGHARRIPAGSKFVFQMHYTPNGRRSEDITKVGVWFSAAKDVTHEVTTRVALNHQFEIPPGAKEHAVGLRLDQFARESRLLSVIPHMHLRGKSFRLDVRRGGMRKTLLHVPAYDFNWQHTYRLQTPLALSDVDALQMQVTFDNSPRNPTNPDPTEFVTWGDQTWQEMAIAFLDIAHPRGKPRVLVTRQEPKSALEQADRDRKIAAEVERFFSRLDRNKDGVVVRDEVPDAFRRFGFYELDHNGDDRIERSEIEAEAAVRVDRRTLPSSR